MCFMLHIFQFNEGTQSIYSSRCPRNTYNNFFGHSSLTAFNTSLISLAVYLLPNNLSKIFDFKDNLGEQPHANGCPPPLNLLAIFNKFTFLFKPAYSDTDLLE